MMGAIQWMRAGAAVHANEKRPCFDKQISGKYQGTHDREKDSAEDGGRKTLLWRKPSAFGIELFAVSRVFVKDGICQRNHEAHEDTEKSEARDTG